MTKRIYIILISVCIISLVVLVSVKLFGHLQWRSTQFQRFEDGPFAFILLEKGLKRSIIEVQVFNTDGKPEVGLEVLIRNNSGPNVGITDANGRVDIHVAEEDVEEIQINKQTVLTRPNAYAFRYPAIDPGLRVLILKKLPPDRGL